MQLPLTSVRSYLSSRGFGTGGTNLFEYTMPDSPNTCTVVYPTGGYVTIGDPIRHPRFSIQHRNSSSASGSTVVSSIYAAFHNQWNVIPEFAGRYEVMNEAGAYFKDANTRAVFTIDVIVVTSTQ